MHEACDDKHDRESLLRWNATSAAGKRAQEQDSQHGQMAATITAAVACRASCLVCGLSSDSYPRCLTQDSCITSTDLLQKPFQPLQLATQASHQVVIIISQDLSCSTPGQPGITLGFSSN